METFLSSTSRILLIAFALCVAVPSARSQDLPAPATSVTPAGESSVPAGGEGLLCATAEANAAVLATAPGLRTSPAREAGALAELARRLGDLKVVGPALLAGYVTGRVRGVPDLSAASARVAGATVGAALLCGGLQYTAGRSELLDGSGASFPSARTTIAFAAAAAAHAESGAGWVPWVAYPAAVAVLVADATDDAHGLADAAAGAALGLAAGHALDRFERSRLSLFERARFMARGSYRDFRVGFQARF